MSTLENVFLYKKGVWLKKFGNHWITPYSICLNSTCIAESQSGTSFPDHSQKEMGLYESAPQGESKSPPPHLRDLDFNLLQSGKLKLTGKCSCLVVTKYLLFP